MHVKVRLETGFGDRLEKIVTIDLVVEDVLPPVSPAHDGCPAVAPRGGGW
jgi:hypothetical protein